MESGDVALFWKRIWRIDNNDFSQSDPLSAETSRRIQPPGHQKRGSLQRGRENCTNVTFRFPLSLPRGGGIAALSNSADKRCCPASRKPSFRQPFPKPDAAFSFPSSFEGTRFQGYQVRMGHRHENSPCDFR